ncbi:hypothetical protein TCAL_08298 [Tigriopus californicus]|uniref:Arginyl-tRNA--protein transferase 1 n=1 Tax=Tigriopus californicus TaxID=6832 RepID=A0A553NBQ1_TIGCA|nr:arginyl-tRNA--protein transferase 1-like [Tigriopus californicus]TRY62876.1 hypothetical protein TCAL_08298 [Tigriopus californicus]|eukprot:TCALIF_08298-PA protein Name:"Similar to ATE1 Arginyl-tRNA--protein transferase 1 (Homo sapiens)" AED:0.07 eAED:0.07 QI:0/-1/0/1/-1/1/1/0/494
MPLSVVEYFGKGEPHQCGYCGGEACSISYGLWGHALSCYDYQDMIDGGWRRSGKYCYKPIMNQTCCPMYTIKCDVHAFKPTKSMKKTLKRFRHFINTGERTKGRGKASRPATAANVNGISEASRSDRNLDEAERRLKTHSANPFSNETDSISKAPNHVKEIKKVPTRDGNPANRPVDVVAKSDRPPTRTMKRKEFRKQRSLQKHNGIDPRLGKTPKNREKTLEELTSLEFSPNAVHNFSIRTVHADSKNPEFNATLEASLAVYQKYQSIIHNDDITKCTKRQWLRFLADSSLIPGEVDGGKLGGFHQQYWLDEQLICVGVVDFLPNCISSVYLYYDPEYSFLSLGTLSALFEISLTRSLLNSYHGQLRYYYMGYYIHNCPKMRYKGNFGPSYLLCPKTFDWVSLVKAGPLLDTAKYTQLAEATSPLQEIDPASNDEVNVEAVQILHLQRKMSFSAYLSLKLEANQPVAKDFEEVEEYAKLIRRPAFNSMLLYRE